MVECRDSSSSSNQVHSPESGASFFLAKYRFLSNSAAASANTSSRYSIQAVLLINPFVIAENHGGKRAKPGSGSVDVAGAPPGSAEFVEGLRTFDVLNMAA